MRRYRLGSVAITLALALFVGLGGTLAATQRALALIPGGPCASAFACNVSICTAGSDTAMLMNGSAGSAQACGGGAPSLALSSSTAGGVGLSFSGANSIAEAGASGTGSLAIANSFAPPTSSAFAPSLAPGISVAAGNTGMAIASAVPLLAGFAPGAASATFGVSAFGGQASATPASSGQTVATCAGSAIAAVATSLNSWLCVASNAVQPGH